MRTAGPFLHTSLLSFDNFFSMKLFFQNRFSLSVICVFPRDRNCFSGRNLIWSAIDHEPYICAGRIKNVISGIEWLLKNKDKYNIRIVNISVGSVSLKKFDESSLLVRSINSLWEAGLVVVTAAGNNGPSDYTIGAPGNSRKIITVGTSDSVKGKFTHDFSGRGPTMNCIKKPDIVAPGLNIISCNNIINRSFYIPRSGTSMSTPIVSGCIALLLQKYPYFTNKDVKLQLKRTAIDLHMPHEKQGWGLIRCDTFLS